MAKAARSGVVRLLVPMMVAMPPTPARRRGKCATGLSSKARDAASDRIDHMRLDPLDGRGVEIVIAQAIGIGRESFRKRSDGLPRRRLADVLRARDPECGGNAAAPAARCRKALRGSFMAFPQCRLPNFGSGP